MIHGIAFTRKVEVDDVTVEKNASNQIQIKDDGVSQAKINFVPTVLLQKITVADAATDTIDFTDLDINTDGQYLLMLEIEAATTTSLYCYINDDTTNTNYYTQQQTSSASTVSASQVNFPYLGETTASKPGRVEAYITIGMGYPVVSWKTARNTSAAPIFQNGVVGKTASVENITQLTIKGGSACFPVGAVARLYKMGGL